MRIEQRAFSDDSENDSHDEKTSPFTPNLVGKVGFSSEMYRLFSGVCIVNETVLLSKNTQKRWDVPCDLCGEKKKKGKENKQTKIVRNGHN